MICIVIYVRLQGTFIGVFMERFYINLSTFFSVVADMIMFKYSGRLFIATLVVNHDATEVVTIL